MEQEAEPPKLKLDSDGKAEPYRTSDGGAEEGTVVYLESKEIIS